MSWCWWYPRSYIGMLELQKLAKGDYMGNDIRENRGAAEDKKPE